MDDMTLRRSPPRGKSPGTRTFTLVEMLVVIAVIATLAAMLMPLLQKSIETGQSVFCKSNLRQVGIATYVYSDVYGGTLPPYRFIFIDCNGSVQPRGFASGLAACINLPNSSQALAYISTTSMDSSGNLPGFTNRNISTIFRCPSDPYPDPSLMRNYPSSYGINALVATDMNNITSRPWRKAGAVRNPSTLAFIADTNGLFLSNGTRSHEYFSNAILPSERHSAKGNILFVDCHVETIEPDILPTNPYDKFWWPQK